jgi:hypothetical protein
VASKRVDGLVIASPGVDIVRTLAPDHRDLGPGERRLQLDYYSAGDVFLQLQCLGARRFELAKPKNAACRGISKLG